jgi:hypothetical protein
MDSSHQNRFFEKMVVVISIFGMLRGAKHVCGKANGLFSMQTTRFRCASA